MRLINGARTRVRAILNVRLVWLGVLAGLVCLGSVPAAAARRHHPKRRASTPRYFYVAENGLNSNSGTSPNHPWRSVSRVNYALLRPGDHVLFHGGQRFDDAALMPGDGYDVSGTARAPVVFSSYGGGVATIPQGVWFGANSYHPSGPSYLTFMYLNLGPNRSFQGTGNHITLFGLSFEDITTPTSSGTAIQAEGSNWVISHNRIDKTAGSGMLLGFTAENAGDPAGGYHFLVANNVITNTGLDPYIGYPTHGIYDKVADVVIRNNYISGFRDDGVSVRYHGATVTHNNIAHGSIGIGWYQYDLTAGTSRFTHNTIVDTKSAGVFVCGVKESCLRPIENFVIAHNRLYNTRHRLNLQPTTGFYKITNNR